MKEKISLSDEFENIGLKFTILGDSAVGKTNLLQRYCKNEFVDSSIPTIGFDYFTKDFNVICNDAEFYNLGEQTYKFKAQFWDTAGQERFRSFTKTLFQGTHGYILVYDITNRNSFIHLDEWMTIIKKEQDTKTLPVYMLLGNKVDLEENRLVGLAEGADWAKKHNMLFMEVSAKTNFENHVNIAFDLLINTTKESVGPELHELLQNNINKLKKEKLTFDKQVKKRCC